MRGLLDTEESDASAIDQRWLARLGRPTPPIALKIETREGVNGLLPVMEAHQMKKSLVCERHIRAYRAVK